MDHVSVLIGLFVTTLILQLGITSISPILTLYIRSLSGDTENVLFVSGLIVSIAGVSAIISSPTLGKLGTALGTKSFIRRINSFFYLLHSHGVCANTFSVRCFTIPFRFFNRCFNAIN